MTLSSVTHVCTLCQNTSSGKLGGRRLTTVLSLSGFSSFDGSLSVDLRDFCFGGFVGVVDEAATAVDMAEADLEPTTISQQPAKKI